MPNRAIPRRALLKGGAAALAGLAAARVNVAALAQTSESESLDELGRRAAGLIGAGAAPLPDIPDSDFAAFIDGFADAKVILLGESTHGTDEFYRARSAITERLIREHGFTIVAVEADWPDAARIDAYIRGRTDLPSALTPFQRFPVWMWRNRAVRDLVDRLHEINGAIAEPARQVGFYGLDLYSLPSSMDAVVDFVKRFDPQALKEVHERYGCLAPYKENPETYGAIAMTATVDTCAEDVLSVIDEVLNDRLKYIEGHDAALFHAVQNARVVAASEAY
jgi:erythromycin esterase-like protein